MSWNSSSKRFLSKSFCVQNDPQKRDVLQAKCSNLPCSQSEAQKSLDGLENGILWIPCPHWYLCCMGNIIIMVFCEGTIFPNRHFKITTNHFTATIPSHICAHSHWSIVTTGNSWPHGRVTCEPHGYCMFECSYCIFAWLLYVQRTVRYGRVCSASFDQLCDLLIDSCLHGL